MATFHGGGIALDLHSAGLSALVGGAEDIQASSTNWSFVQKDGATVLSVNSFIGENLVYDASGAAVSGAFNTWINDSYLPGGGVAGWVADGFSIAAHPLSVALLANDAYPLFSQILNGDDTITGGNEGDLLDGFRGIDSVYGQDGNDILFGAEGNDRLFGGNGADTLSGGRGHDRLARGAGWDKFLFDTQPFAVNADRIVDFNVDRDTIQLSVKIFDELALGKLPGGAFTIGSAAADRSDRVIYDNATGQLFFDADGSSSAHAQQLIATLDTGLALTADDFRII